MSHAKDQNSDGRLWHKSLFHYPLKKVYFKSISDSFSAQNLSKIWQEFTVFILNFANEKRGKIQIVHENRELLPNFL